MTLASERLLIFILAFVQFTHTVDFMIMMPLGPFLMTEFNVSAAGFGYLVSSYNLAAAFAGLCAAFFIDELDRKKTLLFCYFGFSIGTIACGLADGYAFLISARALAGLFGGVLNGLILTMIGEAFPKERQGYVTGLVMASFSIAAVAGVPIGLFLASKLSWQVPFLSIGGISLAAWALALFYLPNVERPQVQNALQKNRLRDILETLKIPRHLAAYGITSMLMLGGFSVISFISPYVISNGILTQDQLPISYLIGGAATFFSLPLIGKISDRKGRGQTFRVVSLVSIFAILLMTHLRPAAIGLVYLASTFFTVFVSGRMGAGMMFINSIVLPERRGSFMSINATIQNLFSAAAATVGGLIVYQASPEAPLENYHLVGYFATLCTVGAIFMSRLAQKMPEPELAPIQHHS